MTGDRLSLEFIGGLARFNRDGDVAPCGCSVLDACDSIKFDDGAGRGSGVAEFGLHCKGCGERLVWNARNAEVDAVCSEMNKIAVSLGISGDDPRSLALVALGNRLRAAMGEVSHG